MSNASWLKGRVVSGFGGFYQVLTESSRTVTCKGRGRLKKEFQSILTGDLVEISRQEDGTGMIESIRPRRSVLPRPHIANVDLALIVLAWKLPDYDLLLLPYESAEGMDAVRSLFAQAKPGMRIGILIGPERGFEPSEVDAAVEAGWKVLSLGRRILRTETAGMTVMANLMLQLEP